MHLKNNKVFGLFLTHNPICNLPEPISNSLLIWPKQYICPTFIDFTNINNFDQLFNIHSKLTLQKTKVILEFLNSQNLYNFNYISYKILYINNLDYNITNIIDITTANLIQNHITVSLQLL